MSQTQLDPRLIGNGSYFTTTGSKTILATERGYFLHKTGSAATWAPQDASVMGAGWWATIRVDGSPLTIDPQDSETIDGASSVIIPPGYTVDLFCNGTAFFTTLRRGPWVDLGTYDGAGLSSLALSDLSGFRRLRIGGFLRPTTDAQGLELRTSSNNGSSFDTGASDYSWERSRLTGGAQDAGNDADDTSIRVGWVAAGNAATEGVSFRIDIDQFNQADHCWIDTEAMVRNSSGVLNRVSLCGFRLSTTARDAVQLRFSSGTIAAGKVTFEGMA